MEKDLVDILCEISDRETMHKFLSEILTVAEKKDLILRWELLKQLARGKSQRSIAADLHISLCKITRGAKILKDPSSVCYQKLKQDKP
ncbi:transcriptional regulator [Thermospira aquatica]|uniref:Transcriptional regulator n=2 Tax=Thermospira aquatica TaxID=2828656 RepID=A0AAX3BG85_9SPIR|nr:transcriptional regulator [Thermospira aquatica]